MWSKNSLAFFGKNTSFVMTSGLVGSDLPDYVFIRNSVQCRINISLRLKHPVKDRCRPTECFLSSCTAGVLSFFKL